MPKGEAPGAPIFSGCTHFSRRLGRPPIAQQHESRVAQEDFQVWKLQVRADRSATVLCDDGNGNVVYTQEIPFTDFPLDEVNAYSPTHVPQSSAILHTQRGGPSSHKEWTASFAFRFTCASGNPN